MTSFGVESDARSFLDAVSDEEGPCGPPAQAFTRARWPETQHIAARSAAGQPGKEHGFFRIRIERADLRDLTRTGSRRGGPRFVNSWNRRSAVGTSCASFGR